MAEEENNRSGIIVSDPFLDAVGVLLVIMLLVQILANLPEALGSIFETVFDVLSLKGFNWDIVYAIAYGLAVVFAVLTTAGTVYALRRHYEIRKAEKRQLDKLTRDAISGESTENSRWKQVLSYAASDDHQLWRLAIIEADVMLDEMLSSMGYSQDSLGDKLRSAERADFFTIDEAWDAHKVRNSIAHEGSGYDLSRRELENTIDKYRKVFREFSYV